LPRQTYGVVCSYQGIEIVSIIAGVLILDDDSLILHFPKVNPFHVGEKLTIHLDNRTGIEEFTNELRVYRCSYKALVTEEKNDEIKVIPQEYLLRFSNKSEIIYVNSNYDYPFDNRKIIELEPSHLTVNVLPDPHEKENKLGVWITRAVDRPHTTVMAFLSSKNDDIFVISQKGTFKSSLIHKDDRCMFAIDHRASYHFEKRYEWNYTIIKAKARIVEKNDPMFFEIQTMFVEKNPWELLFFTDPQVEMFHLEPIEIMCPEKYYPK
jgi:hypothetical protein